MKLSQFFISTLKEAPAEAELISHRLMLRAGLIRRLGSGLYTWMPLGLRVLRRVEAVVRAEMNRAGALEVLMPTIIPAELWQETGRWDKFGPQMLKIRDRHEREFCFGPTHEEVITDLARREIRSYRQLPVNFYQVQTKFRDEIRPRFGVMRAREFLMKDAYSFHADTSSLEATYALMHETYHRIFTRLGLRFRAVAADTGAIGGTGSHEFHVLAESGEDLIAYSPASDFAANVELCPTLPPPAPRSGPQESLLRVATPGITECAAVAEFLALPLDRVVKSLAVLHEGRFTLVLLRGDHSLNEIKLQKFLGAGPWRLATEAEIRAHFGTPPGFIGPIAVGEDIRRIADFAVMNMADFACGAYAEGFHWRGANWGRDVPEVAEVADLRNAVAGDPSPDGSGPLELCRGIEVGHIFQLRSTYSRAMQAEFLDEAGQTQPMEMGCYGIGVSRIVGAAIEQNHDEKGIIWPWAMAPFQVALAPIGYGRSSLVRETAERLYAELAVAGVEVLLDDRDERPGVMFADLELIGIPLRVTIGERGLKEGKVEVQRRGDPAVAVIAVDAVPAFVAALPQ